MNKVEVRSQKAEGRAKRVPSGKWRVANIEPVASGAFDLRSRFAAPYLLLFVLVTWQLPLVTALRAQQPATTTVQDTVYRSDGSLASGSVVVSWPSFVTADNKAVFGGTKTITLTNGALVVALVPNVGGNPGGTSYKVKYYQSGGVWAEETWIVPGSQTAVTLAQVRVTAAPGGGGVTVSPNQVVGTAVVQEPTTTQPITAPASTGVPLQIKGRSGNNSHLFDIFDNSSTPTNQGYFDAGGSLFLSKAPTFSSFTEGSIPFAGSGGLLSQDNQNLYWDAAGKSMWLGPRTGLAGADWTWAPGLFTQINQMGTGAVTWDDIYSNSAGVFYTESGNSSGPPNPRGLVVQALGYNDSGAQSIFPLTVEADMIGAGTVNDLMAMSTVLTQSGGTVNNAYGLWVSTPSKDAGTMVNAYGVKIEDQTTATNNWAIKTGAGKVEFGDAVTAPNVNGARYASQFAGADAGAKIAAAIADLPSTGGTVDARGLEGNQTSSVNPFDGVTKPVQLLLGGVSLTSTAAWTLPSGSAIRGSGTGATTLTFSGLDDNTDGLTLTVDNVLKWTAVEKLEISMSKAGRDAIRINGGDHIVIKDVQVTDFARDGIHVEPSANSEWTENLTLENIRTYLNSSPAGTIRDAIHFELPTALTGIFINEVTLKTVNVRGFGRNALRFVIDNNGSGVTLNNFNFWDFHSDALGAAPTDVNAIYFEKGAGAGSNQAPLFTFIGGGVEDTGSTPTAQAIGVPSSGMVQGLKLINFGVANYADSGSAQSRWVDNPNNVTNLQILGQNDSRLWGATYALGGMSVGEFSTPPGGGLYVSGNVGIGTNNPGQKAEIYNGQLLVNSDNDSDAILRFKQKDGSNYPNAWIGVPGWSKTTFRIAAPTATGNESAAVYSANAGNPYWSFLTGEAERLRLQSSGASFGNETGQEVARINSSGMFSGRGVDVAGPIRSALTTVAFSATPTFDASLGNSFKITLTADVTSSSISNPQAGEQITLLLCQDGDGHRTMTWPSNLKLSGGSFRLTTTANKCDVLTALYDGSNWYETSRAINE
ncbi:MAG: hypothetical protein HYX72_00765 [Acidobacteria bacterium]|nr:hypothetical protein [Acidobacteriota bacterium]